MTLQAIIEALQAKILACPYEALLEKEFDLVFAGDLMSDVLAKVRCNTDTTLLITGLANSQSYRTAEMLDIPVILYVRDKMPSMEEIALSNSNGTAMLTTKKSMFETCGILYEYKLRGIDTHD